MKKILIITALTLVQSAGPLKAEYDNCEAFAAQASQRHGLPNGLLRAIARTESGRSMGKNGFRAWPWTSNVKGKGYYYSSKEEALNHLTKLTKQGVRSFDVGCMQINYRWHGNNFDTLSDMIDPARNTDYAARYLRDLRAETGGWDGATQYYHSRTPARGRAYLGRVKKVQARLKGPDSSLAAPEIKIAASRTIEEVPTPPVKVKQRQTGPLVSFATPTAYWDNPVLNIGTRPKMP